MDNKLIAELFDNPDLSTEIYHFCMSIPEYRDASKAMDTCAEQMIQKLGFEEYSEFERIVSNYHGWQSRAHYLFGLHLRREVCEAMMRE